MRRLPFVFALAALFSGLHAASTAERVYAAEATCVGYPSSDAGALSFAANDGSGNRQAQAFWWSKADLTISVEASPTIAPEQSAAVEAAIATWQDVLADCLGGVVTLTYVPDAAGVRAQSDIVVHLVQHAGGSAFGGMAVCGPAGCTNTLVAYVGPPGRFGIDPVAPTWHTQGIAMHEIGHALGLGHADNLWTGIDLMAYGWAVPAVNFGRVPDISQCDVDALAYAWSWALDGTAPAKPAALTFPCS